MSVLDEPLKKKIDQIARPPTHFQGGQCLRAEFAPAGDWQHGWIYLSVKKRIGILFFFSSRRRHTILTCDWSSDVCSSDLRTSSAPESPDSVTRSAHRVR